VQQICIFEQALAAGLSFRDFASSHRLSLLPSRATKSSQTQRNYNTKNPFRK